jgi:uncharacterized protein
MSETNPSGSRKNKLIVGLIAAVMFGVTAMSLTTNLSRERKKEAAVQQTLEKLDIRGPGGTHSFQVEVMRNDEQRAKGLMFRQYLPEDRGMLFDFDREQLVTMWMRNTFIPLDMVFIKADGTVHHIHERARPQDETTISSQGNVRFVLEINGGQASKLGLKAGDKVIHGLIK